VTYKHKKTKNQPTMITSKKLNIRVKTVVSFSSKINFGGNTDTTIPPTTTIMESSVFAKK